MANGEVSCDNPVRDVLLRQFDISWALTTYHLDGLTTEECLWRPARKGLHVEAIGAGYWQADWPDRECYDIGPASIAWTTWHIIFWWAMALDHAEGESTLCRDEIPWPGTADAVRASIEQLERRWRSLVMGCTDSDLRSSERTRWPFRDRPFREVAAWVNVELMKNAAEIGLIRFFYASRDA